MRTSDAINATTRTLLTEIDLPEIRWIRFLRDRMRKCTLKSRAQNSTSAAIPVKSLIFRPEICRWAWSKTACCPYRVHSRDTISGRSELRLSPACSPNDQVIVNPSDSLVSGQEVKMVQAALPGDSQ